MGPDMPNLLLDYIKVIYWRLEGIFFSLSSLEPSVSTTSATSHSIFIFIYLFGSFVPVFNQFFLITNYQKQQLKKILFNNRS